MNNKSLTQSARRKPLASAITKTLGGGAALGLAVLAQPVIAQELVLEEVMVTAQKRTESLQDVPISVNAVSGVKMEEAGITNLQGMTAYVPNLTMNQTGIGTIVAIRGISSGINQGFEQSVGQYVDGVYYGRAQLARAPYMDLERVEVLRGPQSILFGKNSIAGAISMVTAKPSDEFEAKITTLYEPEHGEQDVRMILSGPLSENLSGRLAVLSRSIDGYYENTHLDRDESAEEEQVVRGTLLWEASDDFTLTLKAEQGSFDTQGRFMEVVNPTELEGGVPYAAVLSALTGGQYVLDSEQDFKRQSNGDFSNNNTDNLTLTAEWGIGAHTLTSVTGYNAYDFEESCDCDYTGANIFFADSQEDFSQLSQELRITSPGGETVDYIAGVFFQSSELDFNDAIRVPADSIFANITTPPLFLTAGTSTNRAFTQDSSLWAGFAQATWNISDDWRLTVGGRYTSEDKEATRRQYHVDVSGADVGSSNPLLNALYAGFKIEAYDTMSDDRSEGAFTPLLTAQWDATDNAMLYATYTEGFKSGGFDVRSNAHPDASVGVPSLVGVFEYGEEKAQNFELGAKLSLAGGAAELNLALFHTSYEDLQTSQFDGTLGFNVTNAGAATTQGLEMDGRWRATEHLTLSGSLGLLDFTYDKFPNSQCYFGQAPDSVEYPGLCDLSGERREFTPEYQGTLGFEYERNIGESLYWRLTGDAIFSDKYFATANLDPNLVQDAYSKLNLRLALGAQDDRWEVALVGQNLTDTEVVSFGHTTPVSTTLTGGTGTAYYAFYDRPRSLALQGTLRF